MRTHITNALRARSTAIRRAINNYNEAALCLNPPGRTVQWEQATHYQILEDLTLLYESSEDLMQKAWSGPLVRHAMKTFLKIQRAKEEIQSCNVQTKRLHTHLLLEADQFSKSILKATLDKDQYLGPLAEYCSRRLLTNRNLLMRIDAIHHLDGYTGSREPGKPKQSPAQPLSSNMEILLNDARRSIIEMEDVVDEEWEEVEMDDEVYDQTESVSRYLESLTLD
jgi:hypothetical protein